LRFHGRISAALSDSELAALIWGTDGAAGGRKQSQRIGGFKMKGIYKKLTYEDKFARKYWCKKAKRNYIKFIKRYNRRKLRRLLNILDSIN